MKIGETFTFEDLVEMADDVGVKLEITNGILFDPRTQSVTHRRHDGIRQHKSPVVIELECGCRITV
ncbi:MAG TPA: hypothetical protein VNG71_10680 [Pyrinomonadaceae bacterium]|nr:hypothetical protein [Pyrinomonadaceae bacterium]